MSLGSLNFLLLFLILFFGTHCAHKRPQGTPSSPPSSNASTPVNPSTGAVTEPNTVPTPEPPKPFSETPKVTLVLGGAGVASFATVGLLKRFQEEGIQIESIITTGWPTLFALAHGFMKSVHDVEWFAMRLQEKDFYKAGIFDASKGYAGHEKLTSLVENAFKQRELSDSKIPVIISAANTDSDGSEIYDRGEWRTPLLKTMSIPGIFRPYPHGKNLDPKNSDQKNVEWISSLQGIEVDEAKKRNARIIVALEMYGDYFDALKSTKQDSSDGIFRKLYYNSLRKSITRELKDISIVGHIKLNHSPTDFEQKRVAIFSGYKEGARLARLVRSSVQP